MHLPADSQPLSPQILLAAYAQGLFPMAESRESTGIRWYCSDPRGVLPLEGFHCPKSLAATIRAGRFEIRLDTAFEQVVDACAASRPSDSETWINREIIEAYVQLHQIGHAHCVEAWRDGCLVGGLYGVTLGGGFFGESMFSRSDAGGRDASKVCLVHLVEHLRARGFVLLDAQVNSSHLEQFGVVDVDLEQYMALLTDAIEVDVAW
jgi:leucyl/phenylalanyl-tRNA--protein transferase